MPGTPHDSEDDDLAPAGFEKFKRPDQKHHMRHKIRRTAERDCGEKSKLSQADVKALRDKGFRGYRCSFCKFWHVTSTFCSQSRK